jgi:hypothetical protein
MIVGMTEKKRIDNDTECEAGQSGMEPKQFEQAVLTAQRGDRESGYRLLRQVLLADPSYAPAWFWMSRLVDDAGRKRECLERALALDPGLKPARDALASLRAQEQDAARPRAAESGRAPQRLGTYLVERGLINRQQLEMALVEQRAGRTWGKRAPLGDILISRGYLTPQALARALLLQQRDRLQARGGRPERLGEYLIVGKLVTPEQLEAALAEQARLRQRGQFLVLGELLVRRGFLKPDTLERVLGRQRQDAYGNLGE